MCINAIKQLTVTLKKINIETFDECMTLYVINELLSTYISLIVALGTF